MFYLWKKNRTYLLFTFSLVVYLTIIVSFLLMLIDPSEKSISEDKFVHFGIFSLLTFFIYYFLTFQSKVWFFKKHRTILTIILSFLIGGTIEYIQLFIPNRSTNIYDMIANLCGTLLTVLTIKNLPKSIKSLQKYSI